MKPSFRYPWLASLLLHAFVLSVAAHNPRAKTQPPPDWAYCPNPPAEAPATQSANTLQHVPNSTAVFTLAQIDDLFDVPDWHPASHPPMPDIVGHGSKPDVYACGYCHLPNGLGRPENSSIAGLPADYIIQQMADFKSGLRKSAEPAALAGCRHGRQGNPREDKEIAGRGRLLRRR